MEGQIKDPKFQRDGNLQIHLLQMINLKNGWESSTIKSIESTRLLSGGGRKEVEGLC